MTSFAADFVNLAASRLREVDVFLCTIAYLCLLVEALDVPTLGYFGHPLLFMVPDDHVVRESFWAKFMGMARSRTVAFAVSDPFLQMQYEYQVGSPRLPAIRSHALYTRASYVPSRNEVLVLDRPHESVLMCLLQRSLGSRQGSWPTLEGRLRAAGSEEYPFGFTTRSLTDKQFSTFAQFKAVVLWAYDMDLITFYEFYSMNVPIFMPEHLPKYLFQQGHESYDHRWAGRRMDPRTQTLWPDTEESPFEERSIDAVHRILQFSDYFRFPHVQYFASIPDLLERLPQSDFVEISHSMAAFNQDALIETGATWRRLLDSVL